MEPGGSATTAQNRIRRRISRRSAVAASLAVGVIGLGVWAAIASSLSSGSGDDPRTTQIEVFTFVESGIVFVEPDTSEIIRRNVQGESRTIGESPWRNPDPIASVPQVRPWEENRLVVGNPAFDVVSCVETADGICGDIVVVRASTGEVVARSRRGRGRRIDRDVVRR